MITDIIIIFVGGFLNGIGIFLSLLNFTIPMDFIATTIRYFIGSLNAFRGYVDIDFFLRWLDALNFFLIALYSWKLLRLMWTWTPFIHKGVPHTTLHHK
jgi:hypothetical protein